MSKIKILDCTLRDGGYVNDWNFGKNVISNIAKSICDASVELIECGFLSKYKKSSIDQSIFASIEEAENYFSKVNNKCNLALMINCGEYKEEHITPYEGGKIRTIRIAFHKHQFDEAQTLCLSLQHNGYTVYFQPMVTMRYTDEEILSLIKWTNENKPAAFYIVDSFGTMRKKIFYEYFIWLIIICVKILKLVFIHIIIYSFLFRMHKN